MEPRTDTDLDSDESLDALRARVLTLALSVTAVGAPLVAAVVLFAAVREQKVNAIVIGLAGFTLVFPLLRVLATRIGSGPSGVAYLLLLLCMAFAIQLRGGVTASGVVFEFLAVLLAALLFGWRGAVVGLGLAVGTFALAGVVVLGGIVPPILPQMWDPMRMDVWVRSGLVLGLFGGAATLAVVYIVARLERARAALGVALAREDEERRRRARAEEERERARAALAEAQRVEALGRLAGGIAHDYNNALTVIAAAAEAAASEPDLSEKVRECLSDISSASRQATDLTRGLLALGRKDVSQPRDVEVAEVFASLCLVARRVLPSGVELVVRGDPSGRVRVDPTQLERALLNLVLNARDAIDASGRIELSSRPESLEPGDPLRGERYVAVRVRDTGRGMSEEVQQQVFEPFFSTKSASAGTGMGLALVRSFATESSGTVAVDSSPGGGTSVTLYLPEAEPSQATNERDADPGPSAPDRRGTRAASILMVEDNSGIRIFSSRTLRDAGFDVRSTDNGDEAIEIVEDSAVPLDLVLIDSVIPGASSVDVIARVRARRPATRIVVCSGYVKDEVVRDQIREGRLRCLHKPFTTADLLECVRDELAHG